jgi:hypothetical protein
VIINRVSFEFSHLGGKNLHLKQHQAMKTKTLVMLLFVCNGTETESIILDKRQMLDSSYEDIDKNEMMPEEFENKDIPHLPCVSTSHAFPRRLSQTQTRLQSL